MALAERTRHASTPEERGVDARLADALDHLLGALDGLPANEHGDEARLQSQLAYGRGQALTRLQERSFLSLLGPRLLYSQRLPYRIARLVPVMCAAAGLAMILAMILVRFLALG
jgi:hypothetical protein